MKTQIIKLTMLFALGLFVLSCSNDDPKEPTIQEDASIVQREDLGMRTGTEFSKLGSRYSKTAARNIFSKAMAVTIKKHPKVKDFLVKTAAEKFNGDFEVLYLRVKDKRINGNSLAELLQRNYQANFNEEIPGDFFKNEVLKADPYLTIYIDAIYFRNPELLSKPVTVAYETAEIDDTETKFYDGYNADGKPVRVTQYTKNDVIFGIKQNERIVLINKKTFLTVNGNPIKNILFLQPKTTPCQQLLNAIVSLFEQAIISGDDYMIAQVMQLNEMYQCICLGDCDDPDADGDGVPDNEDDCPDEAGPASNNGCPEITDPGCAAPAGCDRSNNVTNRKDEIHKFKFASCAAFQSTNIAFEGDREMRASVTYAYLNTITGLAETSTLLKAGSFTKSELRNSNWIGNCTSTKWVTSNWETFTWDYCTYGEQALVYWYEEDNPDSGISLTLSFDFSLGPVNTEAAFTIPFANQNDDLGQSLVQFCDNADGAGYQYNTGNISFYYRMEP